MIPISQIDYPEIVENIVPRHRFMAAYEQRVEPPDKKWQYLLFAAEPYETIAFKVMLALFLSVKLLIVLLS
jgi:splicing factor 3A subunit 2